MNKLIYGLHGLSFIGACLALLNEHKMMLRPSNTSFTQLLRFDLIFTACIYLLLLSGGWLWFGNGKSAMSMLGNGWFQFKLGLFVLLLLISAAPTLFLLTQRKRLEQTTSAQPIQLVYLLRFELLLLVLIAGLAWL